MDMRFQMYDPQILAFSKRKTEATYKERREIREDINYIRAEMERNQSRAGKPVQLSYREREERLRRPGKPDNSWTAVLVAAEIKGEVGGA
jgi:hypothetical protein